MYTRNGDICVQFFGGGKQLIKCLERIFSVYNYITLFSYCGSRSFLCSVP